MLIATASLLCCAMLSAEVLRTAAQDSPPKFIRHPGAAASGISIEIMQEISKLDPDIRFSGEGNFLPLKRIENMLETGELDVFFGFIRSPEREKQYAFVDPPLYQVSDVLVARRNDSIDIRQLEELKALGDDGIVLIAKGVSQGDQLKSMNIQIDDGGRTLSTNLQKLISGRGRFAFQSEIEIRQALRDGPAAFRSELRILPTRFNTGGRYVAFSRKVPPATIARLRAALNKLEANGTLDRIYTHYNQ